MFFLDDYPCLRKTLAKLRFPSQLMMCLSNVSHCYPVLALHFTSLLLTCGNDEGIKDWLKWLVYFIIMFFDYYIYVGHSPFKNCVREFWKLDVQVCYKQCTIYTHCCQCCLVGLCGCTVGCTVGSMECFITTSLL